MRSILCMLQTVVGPDSPTKDLHRFKLAMKVLFLVAIGATLFSVIVFAYVETIEPPKSSEDEANVCLSHAQHTNATTWTVHVAGVSGARDLKAFEAVLMENGTIVDNIEPLREHSSTQLSFVDVDGGGTLGPGDYFNITFKPWTSYKLTIIGRYTGDEKGYEEWETGSTYFPPSIQLASPEALGLDFWKIAVAGASFEATLDRFKAILFKNGGQQDWLNPLTEAPFESMEFVDSDGGGTLSVGDYFIVTCDRGNGYKLRIICRETGNMRGETEWET